MENPLFEDVFPTEPRDFCSFSGGVTKIHLSGTKVGTSNEDEGPQVWYSVLESFGEWDPRKISREIVWLARLVGNEGPSTFTLVYWGWNFPHSLLRAS